MEATCPRCQSDFYWNENDAGKVSSCPECQLELTLPELTPEVLDQLIQERNSNNKTKSALKFKYFSKPQKLALGCIIVVIIYGYWNKSLWQYGINRPWGGQLYGSEHESGNLKARAFRVDGLLHGKYKEWREDGTIKMISHFKMGIPDGSFTEYKSDGSKEWEIIFKNGVMVKNIHWDEDGIGTVRNIPADFLSGFPY